MAVTTHRTGETCNKTGNYMTDCDDKAVQEIREDETFPPCPSCRENVNWSPTT